MIRQKYNSMQYVNIFMPHYSQIFSDSDSRVNVQKRNIIAVMMMILSL